MLTSFARKLRAIPDRTGLMVFSLLALPALAAIWLAASTAALAAPQALAAPGRVVALPPRMNPEPSSEIRDRFHDAVVKGLGKSGGALASTEVRSKIAGQSDLVGCGGSGLALGVATSSEARAMGPGGDTGRICALRAETPPGWAWQGPARW